MKKIALLVVICICLVGLISLVDAKLAFDNDCPISSLDYVNFSNGTAIFLPFAYNETNTTNSNLTIFLGATTYFCNDINDSLLNFAANRKVIFTPEFLEALKTSSCNTTFENTYLENFRRSGDILNSTGTVFCGLVSSTLEATTDPSGVTFNYPAVTGDVNISDEETNNYSGTNLKKYMIAYLMNNPDVTLSGVVSTFANAIDRNLTAACDDVSTITEFFNAGKGNYTTNIQPKLLGINWTAGEQLKPSQGVGGIFGWLLDFALGNQTLPIITAANLSSNKIYLCGVVTAKSHYINSTVTTANNATTVNAVSSVNTTLEISTSTDVTNSTIEMVEYPENPQTAGASGIIELDKYIGIRTDFALENALSSVIIKVYYTDAEVSAAGLDESTLRLYYYNETSGSWVKYDSPNGGVNTIGNYVWANTTHFSNWGLFGSAPAPSERARASYAAPCEENWSCTEWSDCINGTQTRICTDVNNCGTELDKPSETRTCVVAPEEEEVPVPPPVPVVPPPIPPPTKPVPLNILWISLAVIIILLIIINWKYLRKRAKTKRKAKAEKEINKEKILRVMIPLVVISAFFLALFLLKDISITGNAIKMTGVVRPIESTISASASAIPLGLAWFAFAVIALIIVILILKRTKKTKAAKTTKTKFIAEAKKETKQEIVDYVALKSSIDNALSMGFKKQEIKNKLLERGWPKEITKKLLE